MMIRFWCFCLYYVCCFVLVCCVLFRCWMVVFVVLSLMLVVWMLFRYVLWWLWCGIVLVV